MIHIALVEDHSLMRDLLTRQLGSVEELRVTRSFPSGEALLSALPALTVDVIVMDVGLPEMDGVETAEACRATGDRTPILCLTVHCNTRVMERAVKAGVEGYALKHDSFDDLIYAIKSVAEGRRFVSPTLLPKAIEPWLEHRASDNDRLNALSPRETEVVGLIAEGRSTAEIAAELGLSPRTIDAHRRRISEKTGVKGVAELTRFAIAVGLCRSAS